MGAGSGYLSAVLFHLVDAPGAKVVGIEHVPELGEWARENLRRDGLGGEMDEGRVVVVVGDGREGWASEGAFCPTLWVGSEAEDAKARMTRSTWARLRL